MSLAMYRLMSSFGYCRAWWRREDGNHNPIADKHKVDVSRQIITPIVEDLPQLVVKVRDHASPGRCVCR